MKIRSCILVYCFCIVFLSCDDNSYLLGNWDSSSDSLLIRYEVPDNENEVFELPEAAIRIIHIFADEKEIIPVNEEGALTSIPPFSSQLRTSNSITTRMHGTTYFYKGNKGSTIRNTMYIRFSTYDIMGEKSDNELHYDILLSTKEIKMEYMINFPSGNRIGPFKVKWNLKEYSKD